jgi:hypothetical protein
MHRASRLHRLVIAGVIAAAAAVGAVGAVAAVAQSVHASPPAPSVPGRIAVPAGNKVFLVGHASGVQLYSCNPTADGFAWGFVAPRANLYGASGKLVTTHFGGPTWQAMDGSAVVAQRVDGVTVDGSAIPWLLLAKVSTTSGPEGDRLTKTTYIQRTQTTGGLAPAAGDCNASTAGDVVEVPYTADYYFWKATG